ncbi:MAG: polynucleotide adenylyltransferase PcnB [Pseudomonadota bacterium]
MIKKFIDKLASPIKRALGRSSAAHGLGKRVVLDQTTHGIDLGLVDERAIKVVQTLAEAGFEAYIVGGAVRDLLLGLRPKDFDVATNATPEEVKSLFRRAFIIGRRFRIVHVVFGRGREHEVIEVSTFRAIMDAAAASQVTGNEKTSKGELHGKTHVVDAEGRVLRDNVWGPQDQDAARRDFTVNAMYYDPTTQIVVDYHGGLKDAQKKLLRMIGDPVSRYREDPVRIIRAVRFAAKLGFAIEPKSRAPITSMAALLENVPQSRLFDEMIKLLQTGHALASLAELKKQGLHQGVFPILDAVIDAPSTSGRGEFIQLALADTDRRVGENKPVAPSFMLACLLWHDVLDRWELLKKRGEAPFPALQQAVDAVFDARIGDISGRGKLGADMRDTWMMQPRFERRVGSGPFTLVEQPRFRAGFDFLRLRADAREVPDELAEWWEDFSLGTDEERRALIDVAREQDAARRAASSSAAAAGGSKAKPAAMTAHTDSPSEDAPAGESDPAVKKRRRRRRKPAGGAEGAEPTHREPEPSD